ncbi:molecular chaperone DnaJ [Leptospira selangorensis]|uniref:Molecular chaperone DnaJ n=1 Tax=Leptospira selangorensis TaxID=2484982 RepID=A0A5F2C0C8_9LEPT|nr:DnaJ domain-containing protein [Leptospira selangorensis]TGM15524.1 molecular chaperone DnaJ [Leptospira selangorensis]TGM18526.1 molecular chaperone DnaJ [Leptospira selangorensis]
MNARSFDQVKSSLEDVIFEIQSSSNDCEWFISSEKLIEILEIRREDYFKLLYTLRGEREYSSKGSQGFTQDNADLLILLLEKVLKIEGLAYEFAKGGVYFDDTYLDEFRAYLKEIVLSKLERHDLDKELLLLLISSTKKFEDAFDSYFDDQFDVQRLVDNGITEFLERKGFSGDFGADVFLRNYFFQILNTKLFPIRQITSEYRDRAYYEIFGRFREEEREKTKKKKSNFRKKFSSKSFYEDEDAETREHREFLGLSEEYTKAELKNKYKEMIKKYHPDVNKNGLEMTQKIIASYNFLVMKDR